jgi:hypothetical protein
VKGSANFAVTELIYRGRSASVECRNDLHNIRASFDTRYSRKEQSRTESYLSSQTQTPCQFQVSKDLHFSFNQSGLTFVRVVGITIPKILPVTGTFLPGTFRVCSLNADQEGVYGNG